MKTARKTKPATKKPRKAKRRAKRKIGPKGKYTRQVPARARAMAKKGATDKEMATAIGIGLTTFYRWQNRFEGFRKALQAGKEVANKDVEAATYRRAVGYEVLEVTSEPVKVGRREVMRVTKTVIKHVPPDVTACIFWLKNRMPTEWRDVRDYRRHEVPLNDDPFEGVPADKREEALARLEAAIPGLRFGKVRRIGGDGKDAARPSR